MKWINALGLLMQFIAFWLAAPELLGKETLQRFELGLRKFISYIPILILMMVVLGFAISVSIWGTIKGLNASEQGVTENEMINYYIILGVCFAIYGVFLFFFKKIRNWLEVKLAQPLISGLIVNNHIRSTSLILGAILFTIGFLLQLGAVLF
ncbi:MAG: hypothetical protein CL840_08295 [Crocinitomicaceae bacterium]|nr:hypothetical protein [Crocinitomicaceae bacterium]|tara:strand:+ start:13217 stop:13672 length:456 start_codon:yes stop_codon:yes gene_type:complete